MKGKTKTAKHRSKFTINFYSHLNNCHMWCESFLEMNYALTLEFDEAVKSYATQPEYFNVYGKRYTPDFLVEYQSGYSDYVEVKHTSFIDDDFFSRHDLRKEVIYQHNRNELMLVSELDLDSKIISNYELLKPYKQIDIEFIIPLLDSLPKKLTLKKLESHISKHPNSTRAHVWALIAHQFFDFDARFNLGPNTLLMRRLG